MIIDDVHRGITKHKKRKRIGRGPGSGHGKTSGRGHKGFGSRAGSSRRAGFEGGQTPLARRIAKRGFSNARFAKKVAIVNLSTLELRFEAGEVVSPETLDAKGIVKGRYDVLKVLGDGELTKALTVSAHRLSKSAEEAITKAGGTIEIIPPPAPVVKVQRPKPAKAKPAPASKAAPAAPAASNSDTIDDTGVEQDSTADDDAE
jgi:large subunit ribosomal protein L15